MSAYLLDWANVLGRWLHVVAGVAWIGASFYFIWLDNHLRAPAGDEAVARGVGGELWAVHGGGFYHAQKYRVSPPALPRVLHWFKWEAYWTLLSGLFLMAVIYYAQAPAYLIDPAVADLTPASAVAIGIATLAGGWIAYDALCRSPLGRDDRALGAVLALLCAAAAYGLCHAFSGRGAFIHFGAMLGTIMVLNVFFVIIPGQRAMVRAAQEGRAVDPAHGLRGKQRSVHNTYFTLPVVFTMVSNHHAGLYGAHGNWLVLLAISAAGALIRVVFVARHRGRAPAWPAIAAAMLLLGVAIALRPGARGGAQGTSLPSSMAIVQARCVPCHASTPSFAGIDAPPKGVVLETADEVSRQSVRIREQVASRAMPLGNLTHMTEAERATLLDWIERAKAAP